MSSVVEPLPSAAAADAALVERYLTHARVLKRLAPRTLALYRADLDKLARLAAQAGVAPPRCSTTMCAPGWRACMPAVAAGAALR